MSRRDKEITKKFNLLEFCQDIYLDIVVTYLLAHTAWKKLHKIDPIKWRKQLILLLILWPGVTHITFSTRITLESSFWGQIGVEFNFQSTGADYMCGIRSNSAHYQLKDHL